MQIYRNLSQLPKDFGPCIASIGNFDGVHRGHQSILRGVCERARALGMRSIAISFDPHPMRILQPEKAPLLLAPLGERLRLLQRVGLDATLLLDFTPELAEKSAHAFAADILRDALHLRELHEGPDFRFGRHAEAGMSDLAELGRKMGFEVVPHPKLFHRGLPVSSSNIRALVTAGEVKKARWLLGHPFALLSSQIRGRGVGTKLLVPTINLIPHKEIMPANGVYLTWLRIGEQEFESVTNIGVRPTFGELELAIEVHLLDFRELELTPEMPLELSFLDRLREEQRFESHVELKTQILQDVAQAQRYFRLARRLVQRENFL